MHPRLPRRPLVLVCFLVACAAPSEPLPPLTPPPLELGVRHLAGTVLSGGRVDPNLAGKLDPTTARRVACSVTYLRRLPMAGLEPLDTRTRLVIAADGSDPLMPVAQLAAGTRVGVGQNAQEFVVEQTSVEEDRLRLVELDGVLLPGVTVAFHALSKLTVSTAAGTRSKRVVIMVSQSAGQSEPTVALQIDDFLGNEVGSERFLRRQIVLLQDAPVVDGDPLVLVFGSPFGDDRAFLAEVSVSTTVADVSAAIDRARADLRESGAEVLGAGSIMGAAESASHTLATSLQSLELSKFQRSSLVFLAQTTGADLALDLAMTADDATLAAWVQTVGSDQIRKLTEKQEDPKAFAWQLERSAYELLSKRLDDDGLSEELRAVLASRTGEAGRFPGVLSAILPRVTGREELHRQVVAENLEFLRSSDPAARVRAYDWLAASGGVPPGFDPLAPRVERREALAKAEKAAEQKAAAADAVAPHTKQEEKR